MAGRHRYGGRGARASVRVAFAATAITGGISAVAASQSGVDAADRLGAGGTAAVAGAAFAGAAWTPARMAAATPASGPNWSASTGRVAGERRESEASENGTAPSATASTSDASPSSATAQAPLPSSPPAPSLSAAVPVPTPSAARPAPAPSASAPPPRQQSATPFSGTPTVGVLFFTDKTAADHYCTASVVDSPAGDLVITAAHCVYSAGSGPKSDMAFVPGYHDGQSPYGQWTPAQVVAAPSWRNSGDPDSDVGFLVMNKSASGASLQSVTGAAGIGFDTGSGQRVTVPAYPIGAATPVICSNPTSAFSATQTEFDCGGYPDGTSGAPFLVGADDVGAHGTVVGVIGGYQEGGNTPSVSYSAYFGAGIRTLYQTALAAG